MTYSALVTLTILGDDLSRLNVPQLCEWMRSLQDSDGSFRCIGFGSESDTRFVYSAVASSFLIQNWSGVDTTTAAEFILNCWNVAEGGFGLRPGLESHGGATYTALAALALMGKLDLLTDNQRNGIIRFCTFRQQSGCGGFHGRVNKDCDTCYAYWVGASLQILRCDDFISRTSLSQFLDTTFNPLVGGFSKGVSDPPDPYHTHFGICARVFARKDSHKFIHASLGLSTRAYSKKFDN
jgi:geranylgeranyl transferase type-1 subunit beta